MNSLWKSFFGFAEDNPNETYEEAVERAKRLLAEHNYEDACRVLKYAERQNHAEAMYCLAQCYWDGTGVREDAGRAIALWRKSAKLGFEPAVRRSEELRAAKAQCEKEARKPEEE
ncbi:MAG: SEL1-like repeat protein [Prevotella sp.]|nr:SEL1-like repeat protein [Prevotella sp.]